MRISDTENPDELFHLWKSLRPDYTHFSNDGVLLPDVWEKEHPKIAFILKEPNDGFHEIRGNRYGPNGNSRVFWRNLSMWSFTVKQLLSGATVTLDEALARKEDPVGHVAYINLKKKGEWGSVSDHADIQGYVDRDWEFLDHQLRLVSPDVLFCCGTYRYIQSRFTTSHLGHGVYRTPSQTIIDFYHPSCRKSYKTTFEILSRMLATVNDRNARPGAATEVA